MILNYLDKLGCQFIMIKVNNLTKFYRGVPGIQDVSFSVEPGEIVGFLGPNGAGKTTTMKIITAFMPPSSGSATIEGLDCLKDSLEVRKRVGYLPENAPLYTDMPVKMFLSYAAEAKGIDKRELDKETDRVIEECALKEVRKRIIQHLSKGYKQRVGLAQSLLGNPPVLILDEPTIGLDPTQIIEIRELIKNLSGTRTILLSSHILSEVGQICDKIIIINRGRIAAIDRPSNLTSLFQGSIRIRMEIDGPEEEVLNSLSKIKGVIKVEKDSGRNFLIDTERDIDTRGDLSGCVVQSGWKLLELKTLQMSLEDIFVHVVTEKENI